MSEFSTTDSSNAEIQYRVLHKEGIEIKYGEDIIRFGGQIVPNGFDVISSDYNWVKRTGNITKEELMQKAKDYALNQNYILTFISDFDLAKAYWSPDFFPLPSKMHPITKAIVVETIASLTFLLLCMFFPYTLLSLVFAFLSLLCIFLAFIISPIYYLLARHQEKKIICMCSEIYQKRIEELLDLKNRNKIINIWEEQEKELT